MLWGRAVNHTADIDTPCSYKLKPLLLTWFNFNPSMDNSYKAWNEITYPFPNFNGATAEVLEWMNNFILLQWCNGWGFGMDKQFHPTLDWAVIGTHTYIIVTALISHPTTNSTSIDTLGVWSNSTQSLSFNEHKTPGWKHTFNVWSHWTTPLNQSQVRNLEMGPPILRNLLSW